MIMQLMELNIKRKLKQPLLGSDLANVLSQHGWRVLGFGYEAGVAEHPKKPYVLKIFPQDSLYNHFLGIVHANSQNPHFPRFSRTVRAIPGTRYSYVRMEKLLPMKPYDMLQQPSLLCVMNRMYQNKNLEAPVYVRMNVSWDPAEGLIDCNQIKIDPNEQQVFDLIAQKGQELGWSHIDLHASNFMRRENIWVLIDPFI